MRYIILHHHIFKNAGVSLEHCLMSSFGERWSSIEGNQPWSTISNDQLFRFINANPKLCAISSHQARVIRKPYSDYRVFPIIFIRHPLDRVGSCYEYERAVNSDYHTSVAAQKGLKYYIDYCLEDVEQINTAVIRNYQTLHLSRALEGVDDTRKVLAGDLDLNESISFLDNLQAFGVVDEMGASLQLLNDWLTPYFPDIKLKPVVLNSSNRIGTTVDERITRLKEEVGGTRYRRIIENNLLDLSLYAFAKQKLFELCKRK